MTNVNYGSAVCTCDFLSSDMKILIGLTLCARILLSLFLCLSLSFSLSIPHLPCPSLSLSVCLSLLLSLFLPPPLLFLSFFLSLSNSKSLSLNLPLSLSLPLFLSLSCPCPCPCPLNFQHFPPSLYLLSVSPSAVANGCDFSLRLPYIPFILFAPSVSIVRIHLHFYVV